MKYTKKLLSLVLVLVLALAMAIPGFAEEQKGSITVNNAVNDKNYIIYRIFDLKLVEGTSGTSAKVSYTIADKWAGFFGVGQDGAKYIVAEQGDLTNQIVVNGETKWINITNGNVADFAQDALNYALKHSVANDGSQKASGNTVTFENLALGYYMVYPEGATDITQGNSSICALTSTVPDAIVTPKAEYPTIDKEVNDAEVEYGQVVEYTITGKVPDTTGYEDYTYTVNDTMSGLTLTGEYDVKIGGTSIKESSNVTGTVPAAGATTFTMTINVMKYQEQVGEPIVITYKAKVSKDAVVIGPEGNANNATLVYTNKPGETTTSTPETVKVYTCQIDIEKVDGSDTSKKLSGAEFALMNAEGKYYKLTDGVVSWVTIADATYDNIVANATVVTTNELGAAAFQGLQAGTYQLVEIKAPQGYNLLTSPESVTINASGDNAHVTAKATVENNTGSALPGTGGMGTTIFYTLGGVLVVGAAILLVTKKRVHDVEG